MIFAFLVAATTCAAAWFLSGNTQDRCIGYLFALADAVLWLFAGLSAGKLIIVAVAAFCALCFCRPYLRALLFARLRRHHAQ